MFILPVLIDTFDLYHCILSMTLTLAMCHRVIGKQKPVGFIFISMDQIEIWCGVEANQVKYPDTTFK